MTVLSFSKLFFTNSIRVDFNPLAFPYDWVICIAYAVILLVFGASYWRLYKDKSLDSLSFKKIQLLAFVQLFVASFSMPLLSNDVFVYLAHGELSNRGYDVYSVDVLKNSIWYNYIGDWKDAPCVYGPINLLIAKAAAFFSFGSIWLAIFVYKLIHLLFGCFLIFSAGLISKKSSDIILISFSPALWLHNISQIHNDLTGCILITGAVICLLRKKWLLAFFLVGLSVASKISYGIYVPFITLLCFFSGEKLTLKNSATTALGIVLIIGTIFISYAIFWRSAESVNVPMKYVSIQPASKTFAEITSVAITEYYRNDEYHSKLLKTKEGLAEFQEFKNQIWTVVRKAFNYLGVVIVFITTLIFIIKTRFKLSQPILVEYFIKISFVFYFIFLHVFNAWYMVAFIPLLLLLNNMVGYKKYFIVITAYSGLHMILQNVGTMSLLFEFMHIITGINLILFLFVFRRRFFTVESLVVKDI